MLIYILKLILLLQDCHIMLFIILFVIKLNLTNNGRRHFKLFTNCHVSWDTLYQRKLLERMFPKLKVGYHLSCMLLALSKKTVFQRLPSSSLLKTLNVSLKCISRSISRTFSLITTRKSWKKYFKIDFSNLLYHHNMEVL